MSNDLTLLGESPFDAIRRTDHYGEYWSARDLMPLLGYEKWERFEDSIDRARLSIQNTAADPDKHASRSREHVATSGNAPDRERINYRLTRYGCYFVALNGDIRKPEIAAAQQYFVMKTREAETRQAAGWAIPASYAEALELAARQAREIEAGKARVAELEPAAHSWETLAEASGDYSLREAAQILDRDAAISTGQNRLAQSLRSLGWIDRASRPYQRHVDAGRLVLRSRSYDHPHSGESVAATQVRITVKGVHDLHQLLGGSGPLLLEVAS